MRPAEFLSRVAPVPAIIACIEYLEWKARAHAQAEAIKWGMPSFLYRGKIVCGIAGFKAHCALWFWQGKAVVGKKAKDGMGQFGRITSLKEVPSTTTIRGYVKKAIKRIEDQSTSP